MDHPSEVEAAPDIDHHLVVTAASRGARADLGPTAWAVLEDLALDGQSDPEGHLVAAANVRRIAIHLGISRTRPPVPWLASLTPASSSVHLVAAAPTVRSFPRPSASPEPGPWSHPDGLGAGTSVSPSRPLGRERTGALV